MSNLNALSFFVFPTFSGWSLHETLKEVARVDILVLFLIWGKPLTFQHRVWCPCGLFRYLLPSGGSSLLSLVCWTFLWKGELCQMPFLCLLRWSRGFCPLFYWYGVLIDFWMFSPTCIPKLGIPLDSGVNPIWSWSFLYVAGFNLPGFSWGSLCYIHKRHWSVVFYSCDVFGWFWYHGDSGLIEWVGNFFFISGPQLSDGNSTLPGNAATLP